MYQGLNPHAVCDASDRRRRGGHGSEYTHACGARELTFIICNYIFNPKIMAKRIPENIIDDVIAAADLVEVMTDFLGSYSMDNPGGLRKKGVNYTCICPFHEDHNDGNLMIRPKKVNKYPNTYHCFVCEARGGVVQWLMKHENMSFMDAIRWLGKKYNIDVDDIPVNYTPPPPRPVPPPLPTLIIPRKMVAARVDNHGDPLCTWIRHLPWDEPQRARVEQVLKDYCVGHAAVKQRYQEHHFTVFWQIDAEGNPRTGHYMKYKTTGKRMHKEDDRYNTDWFHSLLERNKVTSVYDPEKQEPRQCLFGEHLLKRYPGAPICLVESEKTAVLMAIAYGNHPMQLWLACAGIGNLNAERLAPLIKQRRRIILYPDRDGIEKWQAKAKELNYDRVTIDTRAVTEWWKECDGPKADIADVVVRIIKENAKALPPSNTEHIINKLENQ